MKLSIKKGTTSKIVHIFVNDSSVSTGAGLTGLVYNSAGLTAYYVRPGESSATAISLATQTLGTWTSGGFKEESSANMPGLYEFGIPDACLADSAGKDQVVIMLKGATNMAPVLLEIELVAYDPQDTVRLGLTALPNAAANANGGLPILSVSGTTLGYTVTTVTTVTNQLTAAAVAAGVWRDAVAGDFAVSGSIGLSLGAAFASLGSSIFTVAALQNAPTSSAPTVAQIWGHLVDGTYDVKAYLAAAGACAAGACSNAPASPTFTSLDGLTTYVDGSADSNGNRFSISYNLP